MFKKISASLLTVITITLLMIPAASFGTVGILPMPKMVILNNAGKPCVSCKICTYESNSSIAKATYTDSTGSTPNANPVIANSRGEAGIWYSGSIKIKVMAPEQTSCSTGVALYTVDSIPAVESLTFTLDEWIDTSATSWVYVAATQFSVTGDKRSEFHVGRRVKATSGDVLYGRITAVSYSAPNTTVTVAWDTNSLDSGGITDMQLSVNTATNSSISVGMVSSGTVTATWTLGGPIISSASNTWSGNQVVTGNITSTGTNSHGGTQVFTNNITSYGTNSHGGSQIYTGSITSYGTNSHGGAHTFTGNINSSGTNTLSGTQNISGPVVLTGNIVSSGTATLSGNVVFNTGSNLVTTQSATWDSRPRSAVVTKTAGYTISSSDLGKSYIFNLSSAATLTLPDANSVPAGSEITVRNTSLAYNLTVAGTVSGTANPTITGGYDWKIYSDGSAWKGTVTSAVELISEETYSTLSGSSSQIDLGTVKTGEVIFVTGCINGCSVGTTSSCKVSVSKPSGTATFSFCGSGSNVTEIDSLISPAVGSFSGNACVSDFIDVTGSGTLVLKVTPTIAGGGSYSSTAIRARFLKNF